MDLSKVSYYNWRKEMKVAKCITPKKGFIKKVFCGTLFLRPAFSDWKKFSEFVYFLIFDEKICLVSTFHRCDNSEKRVINCHLAAATIFTNHSEHKLLTFSLRKHEQFISVWRNTKQFFSVLRSAQFQRRNCFVFKI